MCRYNKPSATLTSGGYWDSSHHKNWKVPFLRIFYTFKYQQISGDCPLLYNYTTCTKLKYIEHSRMINASFETKCVTEHSPVTFCPSQSMASSACSATLDSMWRRRCRVSPLQGGSRKIRSWRACSWSARASAMVGGEGERGGHHIDVNYTSETTTENTADAVCV